MRTLSAELLAAQKVATGIPYPKVEIRQRIGIATRLDFLSAYEGQESDYYNAVTCTGYGSEIFLIRARNDASFSPIRLYRQTVTNPGVGSDFSQWTYIADTSHAGTALASLGALVIHFWVDTDHKTIKYQESPTYGLGWGSIQTLLTATNSVYHLAAAINPNGHVCLFYFEWDTIKAVKRVSGGIWSNPVTWTNSLDIVSGIAVAYELDWNLAISGRTATDQRGVWTCIYGDDGAVPLGTWSPLKDVLLSDNPNIDYQQPSLAFDGERHRLSFLESHAADERYHRHYLSFNIDTFIDNLWREPYPFYLPGEFFHTYALSIAIAPTKAFLSTSYAVWIAELSPPPIEVTKDLLDIRQAILPIGDAPIGLMSVELDNTSGQYANFDRQGCELLFSPGYFTTDGPEASPGPSFWIESWDYISRPARSSIIIHAADAALLLSSWHARRQFTWPAGTLSVKQLITYILARAGIPLQTQASSSLIDDLQPAFTIHPAQTGLQALKSLLALVSDVLFFRESTAWLTTPNGYFGYPYFLPATPTQHPIWEGRYSQVAQAINWVQVWGTSTPRIMVDRFEWPQLLLSLDRLHQVHNLNIDSLDLAEQLCYALLTEARRQSIDGDISVPPNCAGELWDHITVTDERVGFDYVHYRVRAIETHYNAQKSTYSQKLLLAYAGWGGGI